MSLIRLGARGDEVRKIQHKLRITIDGHFGPQTERAVMTWQRANGLVPDGIVGASTWSKMFPVRVVITEPDPGPATHGMNLEKLRGHVPERVVHDLPYVIDRFEINTPLRLTHFLSQCSHESGGFRLVEENLNYSADGLRRIFSRYFPGNLAESYARDPLRIASRVYGGRMGNGPEETMEGYIYRGRGYIQLTGKDNYRAFNSIVVEDVVENPDLVSTHYPLLSAAWFFNRRGINSIADGGASDHVITQVTRRVNGGVNGLNDRMREFRRLYQVIL